MKKSLILTSSFESKIFVLRRGPSGKLLKRRVVSDGPLRGVNLNRAKNTCDFRKHFVVFDHFTPL